MCALTERPVWTMQGELDFFQELFDASQGLTPSAGVSLLCTTQCFWKSRWGGAAREPLQATPSRRGPLQALRTQAPVRPLQLLQLHLGALGGVQSAGLQLH